MLSVIKEYRRKKVLEQLAGVPAQKAVIHNFEAVKNVSFVFALSGAADLAELDAVIEYLWGSGIGFRGVVVEQKSAFANNASRDDFRSRMGVAGISFVAKSDLDWIGVPNNADFVGKECSLFISLVREPSFTVSWIVMQAKAECIIGMENNPKLPYTFVLEPHRQGNSDFSYTDYLESLFNYLKAFNCITSIEEEEEF